MSGKINNYIEGVRTEIKKVSWLSNNELIGYGGLVNISWENLRGEISFLLKTDVANTKKDYDEYFPNFLILIQNIDDLLDGSVCHSGFKRLN